MVPARNRASSASAASGFPRPNLSAVMHFASNSSQFTRARGDGRDHTSSALAASEFYFRIHAFGKQLRPSSREYTLIAPTEGHASSPPAASGVSIPQTFGSRPYVSCPPGTIVSISHIKGFHAPSFPAVMHLESKSVPVHSRGR